MNTAELLNELKAILPAGGLLYGAALRDRYCHIWKMDEPLQAVAVALPKTTEELSKILALCHHADQPISIHGGLTNLVGGTETLKEELVISLEKMNEIEELDTQSRTMTVQSGVILEEIQNISKENQLFFPLNFGAKGSAQIGGIISTNAGGLRVLRYGMTRNLILGLEAVLMDGTIVSSMKKIIKDNSGYDLKQLFVGSEGTLGVVTKAVLKLQELPTSRTSAMASVASYEQVLKLLKHMDAGMGGRLSGFELMWNSFYSMATTPPAMMKPPIAQDAPYYVLIEGLGNNLEAEKASLEILLHQALEQELVLDAVMADTQSDLDWFWKIREDVHAITSQFAIDQHFDISLPLPLIGETLENIQAELRVLEGVKRFVVFGHVADGNIHLIIDKTNASPDLTSAINDIVYGPLKSIGGSVSAEHGIGVHKKAYLPLCRTEEEISLMRLLKKSLDPKNLLNRGRIIDVE